jgi:hypothetical protein
MPSTKARAEHNGTAEQTVIGRATAVVANVSAQARTTAADTSEIVATRAPAALAASRGVIARALAALRRSSSGSLALGTVFTAGMSGGMLLSRAPRLLVALALLPTVLLGGTLLARGTADGGVPSHGART